MAPSLPYACPPPRAPRVAGQHDGVLAGLRVATLSKNDDERVCLCLLAWLLLLPCLARLAACIGDNEE
jgi:hypothetical protein